MSDPAAADRRPSQWSSYIRNHQDSSGTTTPLSTTAAPSPSKPSWFRRGSDSSNPRSPPPRALIAAGPLHNHVAADDIYSSSPQTSEVGQPLSLSRETNPRSASPSEYEDDDMPPAPAPARFYPKPSLDPPLTDLPPPVMPPPMRANKPFMDADEAAAERSRRADEHRIKMRERKENQKVEALMQRQEQRMSRRSAKKPTNFVASGADVPPVPLMPAPVVRDSLVVPPAQHEIDEQGRRSTLERNIDSLIAENSVDGHSETGSMTNQSARSAAGVSQPPSYPKLDALGAPLHVATSRSAGRTAQNGVPNENRLSAAISLKRGDGRTSSFYSAADIEGSSPLDSAFGLGPTTPVSAPRPTSSYLSPSDAVLPRTVRREHSGSSLRVRSVADSQMDLLPDDGKSRDATELFKYEEPLGPAKRVSVGPSSQRNTRTVSILKYTDHPQAEPMLIQKEKSPAASVMTSAEEERRMGESLYDGDDEFIAFEDLTLTRRLAHLCIIFPYAILGVLVRFGLNNVFDFDGGSISALLWSQGVSAAIFGLVLGKREDLNTLYPPIWTGLSIGFAGSINSFSGWMLQAFIAFSNFNDYDRGAFQNILDGFSQLAITLVVAQGAMSFGLHCARFVPSLPDAWRTSPSRLSPTPRADVFTIALSVAAYVVAIISYSFFSGTPYWRHALVFPMILAPGGAVVRYYLSRLNAVREPLGRVNGIPLGTLISNLLGTAVLAACFILMRLDLKTSVTTVQCAALHSLSIGFAGTMTNLAALVFEARAVWQSNRWRWCYVLGSMAAGQALMVAIFGGLYWGGSTVSEVCSLR